jgi:hypothetical protein
MRALSSVCNRSSFPFAAGEAVSCGARPSRPGRIRSFQAPPEKSPPEKSGPSLGVESLGRKWPEMAWLSHQPEKKMIST